jgi:hypothetical protein
VVKTVTKLIRYISIANENVSTGGKIINPIIEITNKISPGTKYNNDFLKVLKNNIGGKDKTKKPR